MFIDSHAHLNFKEFEKERNDVLKRSFEVEVKKIVNVGSNYKTSHKCVEIVREYSSTRMKSSGEVLNSSRLRSNNNIKMFATVGCHPIHLSQDITETAKFDGKEYSFVTKNEKFDSEKYQQLIDDNKDIIVGIGETGLDYFRLDKDIDKCKQIQREVFKKHVELAIKNNLPLILHCRGSEKDPYGAYDEMIEILKSYSSSKTRSLSNSSHICSNDKLRGVAHCFVGNLDQAKEFVKMGFYIGVNGILTFKNSKEVRDVVRQIPLEKILLETDCPFLAPDPYRGKRNEPMYIPVIAQKIADLKEIDVKQVEKQTTKNSEELFGI